MPDRRDNDRRERDKQIDEAWKDLRHIQRLRAERLGSDYGSSRGAAPRAQLPRHSRAGSRSEPRAKPRSERQSPSSSRPKLEHGDAPEGPRGREIIPYHDPDRPRSPSIGSDSTLVIDPNDTSGRGSSRRARSRRHRRRRRSRRRTSDDDSYVRPDRPPTWSYGYYYNHLSDGDPYRASGSSHYHHSHGYDVQDHSPSRRRRYCERNWDQDHGDYAHSSHSTPAWHQDHADWDCRSASDRSRTSRHRDHTRETRSASRSAGRRSQSSRSRSKRSQSRESQSKKSQRNRSRRTDEDDRRSEPRVRTSRRRRDPLYGYQYIPPGADLVYPEGVHITYVYE